MTKTNDGEKSIKLYVKARDTDEKHGSAFHPYRRAVNCEKARNPPRQIAKALSAALVLIVSRARPPLEHS
jgi:hypothetical protein